MGQTGIGRRLGSRPEGRNWNVLGLGDVSAGVGGGALVPTGELVCTWRTGRCCWRGEDGEPDANGERGGEMGNAGGTGTGTLGSAVFVAGRASDLRRLL
jgi:hypothetical protein